MTILVGHPHKCPTFFVLIPRGSQQVNKSTSWCLIGRISPICPMLTNVKAPLRHFAPKYPLFAVSIPRIIKWM